jgi:hypothetical protein
LLTFLSTCNLSGIVYGLVEAALSSLMYQLLW